MKVRCDRRALLDVATLVAGVTANRATRPILQTILLTAKKGEAQEGEEEVKGRLELTATDLELSIQTTHEALAVDEEGVLAIPAETFLSILKEARGGSIDLATDGLVALFRSAGGQFRVSTESPEDFPEVPKPVDDSFVTIPAEIFRTLASRTEFSAAKDLGRYAINGILVEAEDQALRFISTDGRRMAFGEHVLPEPVSRPFKEILPLKGILHFLKTLRADAETVQLAMAGRKTLLKCGDTVLSATSLEAEFPDYRGAIPARGEPSVMLERDDFFTCVRQAAVMAGDDARSVTLEFSEGSLVVTGHVEGRGDARSEMAANYAGPETKISFNPDYLLDFGKVELPESLAFSFQDHSAAAVFHPVEGFVYVLMPITVT